MRNLGIIILLAAIVIPLCAYQFMGAGGLKRMVTLTGIYAVCKPGGFDAVCFLDADSKDGGLSCLPLKDVSKSGECKK